MRDDRLSIAFVYDDSLDRVGGVTSYVLNLGAELSRRGHQVNYFVGESAIDRIGASGVHSLARNVRVRFNGSAGSMPLIARAPDLHRALAAARPDVLHVQVPYSPLLAGRLIRHAPHTTALVGTFLVSSEQRVARVGATLLGALSASTIRRFDRMIAISDVAAHYARRTFKMRDCTVIPGGVEVHRFGMGGTRGRPAGPSAPTIVFLGNLVPRKGVHDLVSAMPTVLEDLPDARLIIAGSGLLRPRLERLTRRLDIEDAVRFVGTVSEGEKAALLAGCDVACFPSTGGESFGFVLAEAMAADGGVVLAARNPAYAEMLAECPSALFNPRDPRDLATALRQVLNDPAARRQLRLSQAALVPRHDIRDVADATLQVYRSALALRARSYAAPSDLRPVSAV